MSGDGSPIRRSHVSAQDVVAVISTFLSDQSIDERHALVDLGVSSSELLKLSSGLEEEFDVSLDIVDVFTAETVGALAELVAAATLSDAAPAATLSDAAPAAQSPFESSVWSVTDEVDYMAQSAENPSHAAGLDFLQQQFGSERFSLLDCGVMSGVTINHLEARNLKVDYTGLDISEAVISDCRARHPEARWVNMSVFDLAFDNRSVDIVHARHLLEHLPYYETAVREMFRVAHRAVVICLFQIPRDPEILHRRRTRDGYIWLNRYAPGPFEALLDSLSVGVKTRDVTYGRRAERIYHCLLE